MLNVLDRKELIHGELCCEAIYEFSRPLTAKLPNYVDGVEFQVYGIARRRNYERGPVLTLAAGTYTITKAGKPKRISNVVTMMMLADMLSHHHQQPINSEKHYGALGRRVPVGRTAGKTVG